MDAHLKLCDRCTEYVEQMRTTIAARRRGRGELELRPDRDALLHGVPEFQRDRTTESDVRSSRGRLR